MVQQKTVDSQTKAYQRFLSTGGTLASLRAIEQTGTPLKQAAGQLGVNYNTFRKVWAGYKRYTSSLRGQPVSMANVDRNRQRPGGTPQFRQYGTWCGVLNHYLEYYRNEKVLGRVTDRAFVGMYVRIQEEAGAVVDEIINGRINFFDWARRVRKVFADRPRTSRFIRNQNEHIAFDIMITGGKFFRVPFSTDHGALVGVLMGLAEPQTKSFYRQQEVYVEYIKPILAMEDPGRFQHERGKRKGIYINYQ